MSALILDTTAETTAAEQETLPDMPPEFARNELLRLGAGGFCYIRPRYWHDFYAAAQKLNIRLSRSLRFHHGHWTFLLTRIR